MFEECPGFEQIGDEEILWRYQDLPRYLDLLIRKRLFFTRIDQLEDPFEGRFSKSDERLFTEEQRHLSNNLSTALDRTGVRDQQHSHSKMAVTVNAWHHNAAENYAMWNIYARDYGVAVQTTYGRLKESFKETDKDIYIGKVNYYNEETEQMKIAHPLAPFIRKRYIYRYENEIRCCYVVSQADESDFVWEEQNKYNGVFVPVNLNTLIARIYISPYAPTWFRELVERTSQAFHINKEIRQSSVFQSENFL
jgi:hypothetical protein